MVDILWVWGEAFLRWLHVIAGIGWIGSSFYFIHLDYSLKKREGLPPAVQRDEHDGGGAGGAGGVGIFRRLALRPRSIETPRPLH
ncbi:MAG: urate hydroxylase PuuD [Hyphomicrobiaceae bacterium]